jgi:hypothetical protein
VLDGTGYNPILAVVTDGKLFSLFTGFMTGRPVQKPVQICPLLFWIGWQV